MLEPDAVKVASPVLRGLGTGNGSWLLGNSFKYPPAFSAFRLRLLMNIDGALISTDFPKFFCHDL